MKPGRNIKQYEGTLELRRGSRTTPIDKKHVRRSVEKRSWKKEI